MMSLSLHIIGWIVCFYQELQQAMDKLELTLSKSGQGVAVESKDEEIESPENLALLRQRKMVQILWSL